MDNQMVGKEVLAMRPGLVAGRYPEKELLERDAGNKVPLAFTGYLTRLVDCRRGALKTIVAEINRREEGLRLLSNSQLSRMVADLKGRFRVQGLTPALCMQAFALVREVSWRTLDKRHYDVQLMAGWTMLQGRLAEMETGEGKTLSATLAAATAALAGVPVHVLTVNEYLAERDADLMAPLYNALGLKVGKVIQRMPDKERRDGYACDITYCTNKQVQFDYLRDRLLMGNNRNRLRLRLEPAYAQKDRLGQLLLRGLCFAIVDEADSILIDEARTPLILSNSQKTTKDESVFEQALCTARALKEGKDFTINKDSNQVCLSLSAQERLHGCQLPFQSMGQQNSRLWEERIVRALYALHVLKKNRDYLVKDGKVLIVDPNTGRTMPDRSWEKGLQQLVEAKEGCPLTNPNVPLARLTTQRFFRRYLHLGGMTGTAREVGQELWSVYGLRVRRIPLHRRCRREKLPTRIFVSTAHKWAALARSVKKHQLKGQPVLIGTGSVEESEALGAYFSTQGVVHRVLNARQDHAEADIVARAGQRGRVTIATNMAGRGTDIPLAEDAVRLGGLYVIALCRNIAKRIDRQLFGRCARQGDPGSYRVMLSLEDPLVKRHGSIRGISLLGKFANEKGEIPTWLGVMMFRSAQKKVERRHYLERQQLLKHEDRICRMLAFSGPME